MKYLKRIIGLPFFIALNLIGFIFHLFKISFLFMKNGGEAIVYRDSQKKISDICDLIEKKFENNL